MFALLRAIWDFCLYRRQYRVDKHISGGCLCDWHCGYCGFLLDFGALSCKKSQKIKENEMIGLALATFAILVFCGLSLYVIKAIDSLENA